MTDQHADLRAMLETPPSGDITRDAEAMGRWLLHMDFLDEVRALLEERDALKADRDKLAKQLAGFISGTIWLDNDELAKVKAECDALKAEVEKLRAAKSAEDAKAPSVIRDGFPSDSIMEEAARLGRELASSLDDLLKEARRRKESKP